MKSILIIADLKGWAFDFHAHELQKRIKEYQIDIAYCRGSNIRQLSPQYDLIYSMDPMPIPYLFPEKTIIGVRSDWFHMLHPRGAKGMYREGFMGRSASIKGNCCIMHAVNKKQFEIFEKISDIPVLLVQHGVNNELFDVKKYDRVKNNILTVGTSGRRDSPNKKGFGIVNGVCRKMGIEHYKTRYHGKVKKRHMPKFYADIDVYVCMSKMEGLSNPTMEAGAMGIPVISTKSGAAEEMIRDGENGFLIDRNEKSLMEALEKMKDADLRISMGDKLHEEIMKNWTWKVKVKEYKNMFDEFFKIKGE